MELSSSAVARISPRTTRTLALALAATLGGAALNASAALVTLTATDTAGNTSWNTGTRWSDTTAPNAANDYLVPAGLALRTPADSTDTTFAGNSLTVGNNGASNGTLTIKNVTNTTVTINNFTLNKGEIQNGGSSSGAATNITLAGNGLTVGTGGGTINTASAGRTINISAPISGSGPLTTANAGTTTLSGDNSAYSGTFTLSGAAAQLLNLGNANALGTGTFAISNGNAASIDNTSGAAMTLTGNNPITLNNDFVFVGSNDLNLGTGAISMVANRTITANGAGKTLTIGGNIAGGTNVLNVLGTGALALTGTNTLGGVNIGPNGGSTVLRINNSGAVGSGTIFVAGNGGSNRLELVGGAGSIVLANAINQNGKGNATDQAASILNVSGNNTLNGTISVQTGGTFSTIQSDADTLTLGNATVALTTNAPAGTTRNVTLRGAGNILVNGPITNGTAAVAIEKKDAGILTFAAANTYTGSTTVAGGILALAASDRIDNASALILAGGTFATGGNNEVLNTLGLTASSTIDLGNGSSVVAFADSSAQSWTGTLAINNWSGNQLGGGTDQIFVGTNTAGLTPTQLSQVQFAGYPQGASLLTTGELVPVPEPVSLLGLAGAALVAARRRR